jgi:hypothetical protein
MEYNQKKLAEDVLRILYPLRVEWTEAPWLIDTIEKGIFDEDALMELAHLLI